MNKRIGISIFSVLFSFTITAIIIALCSEYSNKNVFFSEDETHINTDIVVSYTIIDKQGNSLIYNKTDEKFNTIRNILSATEVRHENNEIYIIDEKSSERIILNGKYKKIVFTPFYEKQPDGSILLILKDLCKNKSTRYLLDHHDYLVTTISEEDYYEIFS